MRASTSRKTSVLVAPSIGHARARAVQANRGDYRGGAPMFVRCMANQPFTLGRAATQARHVRLGRRLVDEDKLGRVEPALAALPATPRLGDVGPLLLGRMEHFFIGQRQLGQHPWDRSVKEGS